MRFWLVLFAVLLTAMPTLQAQTGEESDAVAVQDVYRTGISPPDLATTRTYQDDDLVVRPFDQERWEKVVEGFDYSEELPEPLPTENFSVPWSGTVLKFISYAIVAVAIGVLLYFIVMAIPFRKRIARRPVEPEPEAPVENIAELDINAMLQSAIREGNFKLAVRWYYLRLLKQLDDKGIVSWRKNKTNRDYLNEVFSRNFLFEDINGLTLLYESVWYGDREVMPEAFDVMRSSFENVLEKVNKSEVA